MLVLLSSAVSAQIVETVPTGSITGTIIAGMAFFSLIGFLLMKVNEENKYKEGWSLLSILFFIFSGFMFNILTFFIMEFSASETWYRVTRALFVITSILFGFGGAILAFIITIMSVIFFITYAVTGKNNEKNNKINESRY